MRTAFILSAVVAIAFGILFFWGSSASSAIPHLINYQGMLTDNSSTPLTGSYNLTFNIWTDTTGGSSLWTETQNGVSVQNGLFNVILGKQTALNLAFEQQYWLEVAVGAETMPRIRFTSVGYAYRAQVADSAIVVTSGSGSNWTLSNFVLYTKSFWGITKGGYFNALHGNQASTMVNLGAACTTGTNGQDYRYSTISGGYGNAAIREWSTIGGGEYNKVSGDWATVGGGYGNIASLDAAFVGGGAGNSATGNGATIAGGHTNIASQQNATVGGGESDTASGTSSMVPGGGYNVAAGDYSFAAGWKAKARHQGSFVWADYTDGDFNSAGPNEFDIRASGGMKVAANNSSYGGYFDNTSGGGDGIRSIANVSSTNDWGAIWAVNQGSSPAIVGKNSLGFAGYFSGNVWVTGSLTKGSGGFKIDHPLDQENKYLYHSFVESPDMMDIYNGNVVLEGNGEVWVKLPEWFEALNRDFRYQLTAIGAPGPDLFVAQEISNNSFKIAGGKPGMKVSWQVTGIRKDPFAEKHRIPVEEEKPANERGKYLHPDAYNLPETRGINYTDKESKK
jgi:hypothetical protein